MAGLGCCEEDGSGSGLREVMDSAVLVKMTRRGGVGKYGAEAESAGKSMKGGNGEVKVHEGTVGVTL